MVVTQAIAYIYYIFEDRDSHSFLPPADSFSKEPFFARRNEMNASEPTPNRNPNSPMEKEKDPAERKVNLSVKACLRGVRGQSASI